MINSVLIEEIESLNSEIGAIQVQIDWLIEQIDHIDNVAIPELAQERGRIETELQSLVITRDAWLSIADGWEAVTDIASFLSLMGVSSLAELIAEAGSTISEEILEGAIMHVINELGWANLNNSIEDLETSKLMLLIEIAEQANIRDQHHNSLLDKVNEKAIMESNLTYLMEGVCP